AAEDRPHVRACRTHLLLRGTITTDRSPRRRDWIGYCGGAVPEPDGVGGALFLWWLFLAGAALPPIFAHASAFATCLISVFAFNPRAGQGLPGFTGTWHFTASAAAGAALNTLTNPATMNVIANAIPRRLIDSILPPGSLEGSRVRS